MAFSLNLPYPLCVQATRLAKRIWSPSAVANAVAYDLRAYFRWQYESTQRFHECYWRTLDWKGKVVLDLGSGMGGRAAYFIEQGAAQVYCVDINVNELEAGANYTAELFPAAAPRIRFLHPDDVPELAFADIALLVDCFEHLLDPQAVLAQTSQWLRTRGVAWIGSIGWYHHAASHCGCYIPIPWCHVVFSERAIIRTIQRVTHEPTYTPNAWDELDGLNRWDNVQTLRDRPGEPLNLLSLRQIRKILDQSDLIVEQFQVHGYSGRGHRLSRVLGGLARIPLAQELFHSYYTAVLRKSAA
jgi:SAM-dependent methyltransferase